MHINTTTALDIGMISNIADEVYNSSIDTNNDYTFEKLLENSINTRCFSMGTIYEFLVNLESYIDSYSVKIIVIEDLVACFNLEYYKNYSLGMFVLWQLFIQLF